MCFCTTWDYSTTYYQCTSKKSVYHTALHHDGTAFLKMGNDVKGDTETFFALASDVVFDGDVKTGVEMYNKELELAEAGL